MRILLANPSYPPVPCGIGQYTACLAEALRADGHEVRVLTSGRVDPGPGVLPLLAEWSVLDYLRALPRFARPRPELVVSGYPSVLPGRRARLLYLLPVLAKLTLARPRVTFIVHEFARTEERARTLLALALRAADDVVAVTDAERTAVIERHPFAAPKIRVVENASSIPPVDPQPAELDALRDQLAGGRPLVVFAGRLTSAEKGFEELVEATASAGAVLAASGILDARDALHARVERKIAELGTDVRWLGYLDSDALARLLQAADVVALPFRGGAESSYTSLLGALVNGAPVVTTRGPNTPEWLQDGENVLLVEPRDAAALRAAIRRLLDDEALAARVRAGARALRPRFEWQRVASAIVRNI